jgi:hypothetical protein
VVSVHELDKYGDQACDWCGTLIKHVFTLSHAEVDEETEAGCVCAEHLSEDYLRPKALLKEFKRVKRAKTRRPPTWHMSYAGNEYFITKGLPVTVFCRFHDGAPVWRWVKAGKFSRAFPTKAQAQDDAEVEGRLN